MELNGLITPPNVIAVCLALIPFLAAAFFPKRLAGRARALPVWTQLSCPALLSLPYVLATCPAGSFRWGWFALYAALPCAAALLLWTERQAGPDRRGAYSKITAGSGSCPCVVSATAAARISAPPTQAKGPRCSPSSSTPRKEPIAGSMFRNTPARDAGTW
jgi:hypothetical protein